MSDLLERLEKGAVWLDKIMPRWEFRIDLDQLNIEAACPLRQLGLSTIAREMLEDDDLLGFWVKHGFWGEDLCENPKLTEQWKELILDRRKASEA